MRYRVESDILVRTENAAKPDAQGSAYLRAMLTDLVPVEHSFDYGCGKLRYREEMLRCTKTLALVDSEIQLSRQQKLCGERTSIRETVQGVNHIGAYNPSEFRRLSTRFNRGFCINVLSVIPIISVRERIVKLVRDMLQPEGTCLFAVQYRNSDFNRMRELPNARPWRDGILIDSLRGFSFYGLISPERLEALVTSVGFKIVDQKLNEGSVYIWAGSPTQRAANLVTADGQTSAGNG